MKLFILLLLISLQSSAQKMTLITDSCKLSKSHLAWEFTDSTISKIEPSAKQVFQAETKPYTMLNDDVLKAIHWEIKGRAGFTLLYDKRLKEWVCVIDEAIENWSDLYYPVAGVTCNTKCQAWLDLIQ